MNSHSAKRKKLQLNDIGDLKNTFYILYATLINFSIFDYVKFIIKLINLRYLYFSIQTICLICYSGW